MLARKINSFIVVAVERVRKCCRTKLRVYVVILCGLFPSFAQARSGSLAIEDMDGGTFTISNGGVFGSMFGTPIINPPQSAILGMHGIFERPVAVGGKVITIFVLCFFRVLLSWNFGESLGKLRVLFFSQAWKVWEKVAFLASLGISW